MDEKILVYITRGELRENEAYFEEFPYMLCIYNSDTGNILFDSLCANMSEAEFFMNMNIDFMLMRTDKVRLEPFGF